MTDTKQPGAVVVIPARGGSKRIPRKNIKPFHGRPIIAWSIAAACALRDVARVVVSTDDDEIAALARSLGAQTPFMRAPELSDDHAGTLEVVRDAVTRLAAPPDTPVCCLYATAPMVTPALLEQGRAMLARSGAAFVFPVVELAAPIERSFQTDGDRIRPVFPDKMAARSQDLPVSYADAGQFYWASASTWRDPDARIWRDAAPIHMPRELVQDIDTHEDWARAERLFAAQRG